MFVVVGLGNPGNKYANTRHNVGFDMIDRLADRYNVKLKDNKMKGISGACEINGEKVMLLKPMTFMNLSGHAIAPFLNYYKAEAENDLIVLSDDISLEPGVIRIRKKGSAGGHNGLKDIINQCGTDGFKRIKIGVGERPENMDLADHVLGHFTKDDRIKVEDAYSRAEEALVLMISGDTDKAMNLYNGKK